MTKPLTDGWVYLQAQRSGRMAQIHWTSHCWCSRLALTTFSLCFHQVVWGEIFCSWWESFPWVLVDWAVEPLSQAKKKKLFLHTVFIVVFVYDCNSPKRIVNTRYILDISQVSQLKGHLQKLICNILPSWLVVLGCNYKQNYIFWQ